MTVGAYTAWMKAIIDADQADTEALNEEYERLIVLDPEVESVADCQEYMGELLQTLAEFREAT